MSSDGTLLGKSISLCVQELKVSKERAYGTVLSYSLHKICALTETNHLSLCVEANYFRALKPGATLGWQKIESVCFEGHCLHS